MKGKKGPNFRYEIPESELRELYQRMSMRDIAAHYGCAESTIWKRLKDYGIEHERYDKHGHRRRKREFSEAHRAAMSAARKGKYGAEANGNWKGGVTLERLRARQSLDYRIWRQKSLERSEFKCQECGAKDGDMCECCGTKIKLHVHHIYSFALYEEKRFDPENSEVLCPKCHYSRHRGKIG